MSSTILTVAFPKAPSSSDLAEVLTSWLIERGLVGPVAEERAGVLLHPPGPRYADLAGSKTLRPTSRSDAGVRVEECARLWCDEDDDRDPVAACPHCGHVHTGPVLDRLLDDFETCGGERQLPCESCSRESALPEWNFPEGFAAASIALRFFNWATGLHPSIRDELAAMAGGEVVEILGRE